MAALVRWSGLLLASAAILSLGVLTQMPWPEPARVPTPREAAYWDMHAVMGKQPSGPDRNAPSRKGHVMATANPTAAYRDIPGHPGYRVGDDGTVWSCWTKEYHKGERGSKAVLGVEWRQMSPFRKADLHFSVKLRGGRQHPVHRLVLLAFVGPCPEGLQCCHNDGNPANNTLANLRWGTPKSNAADRLKHGTHNRGSRHSLVKLTEEQVIAIRAEYAVGRLTQRQLGDRYGVCESTICQLVKRQTWGHVT